MTSGVIDEAHAGGSPGGARCRGAGSKRALRVCALWAGYGLALTSTPALAAATVPVALAYFRRMSAEEAMLEPALGAPYRDYQERSARLLPGMRLVAVKRGGDR